jgi:stage III sporulation protein AC
MSIDFVFKIAAIGIIVAVLDQVLKNAGRNEMATMTTLAGLVIVLIMVVQQISSLFTTIKSVFGL